MEGVSENPISHKFIYLIQRIPEQKSVIENESANHQIFIADEAQNLTPHEIKTIITRAGEGTKMVFTGDISQIDHPYLDSHSNGITYLETFEKRSLLHQLGVRLKF